MNKRVCIFVDGENLRHSICDLFTQFNEFNYLPKSAEWDKFFDWIAQQVSDDKIERVRTYWYVVENIDFSPFELNRARKDLVSLEKIFSKRPKLKAELSKTTSDVEKSKILNEIADDLEKRENEMQKRFNGWTSLQDKIEYSFKSIEFRRAGSIRYNLYDKELGSEKSVDVKLATDLIRLKDIYDIAVIVSGDQDYVPAVDAIKDFGKHVVNVSFVKEDGYMLPVGARRLNQSTDCSLEIKHSDFKKYLKIS
jgi:uncharacterized LabA/DUF88 family protein